MNQHLKELNNEEDIVVLVNAFYTKVQKDETIGHIFSDVAHVDWEKHLPRMYHFGAASSSDPLNTQETRCRSTLL